MSVTSATFLSPSNTSFLCDTEYIIDPLSSPQHETIILDSDQLLSSTESINALYHPDEVFTFDSANVYTQRPVLVSTATAFPYPGFVRHDSSFIQQVIEGVQEERVEVIDDSTRELLSRVKEEAKLSEVEYGRLLKRIECGKVCNVNELLDSCLTM